MVVDISLKFFVAYRSNMLEALGEEELSDDDEEAKIVIDNKVGVEMMDSDILGVATHLLSNKEKNRLSLAETAATQIAQKEAARQRKRRLLMERRSAKWFDPNFELRFSKISGKYFGRYYLGYFLFDFLACVPLLTYEASAGFSTYESIKQD